MGTKNQIGTKSKGGSKMTKVYQTDTSTGDKKEITSQDAISLIELTQNKAGTAYCLNQLARRQSVSMPYGLEISYTGAYPHEWKVYGG